MAQKVEIAKKAYRHFAKLTSEISCTYTQISYSTLAILNEKLNATVQLKIFNQPIRSIREGEELLISRINQLRMSFDRVSSIAQNRGIQFDGSPAAVSKLAGSYGIGEVLPNAVVDDAVILKAQKAADYKLSSLSLAELNKRQHVFHTVHDQIGQLLEELGGYSQQLNIPFDGTPKTINQLTTLGQIAANAPLTYWSFVVLLCLLSA